MNILKHTTSNSQCVEGCLCWLFNSIGGYCTCWLLLRLTAVQAMFLIQNSKWVHIARNPVSCKILAGRGSTNINLWNPVWKQYRYTHPWCVFRNLSLEQKDTQPLENRLINYFKIVELSINYIIPDSIQQPSGFRGKRLIFAWPTTRRGGLTRIRDNGKLSLEFSIDLNLNIFKTPLTSSQWVIRSFYLAVSLLGHSLFKSSQHCCLYSGKWWRGTIEISSSILVQRLQPEELYYIS